MRWNSKGSLRTTAYDLAPPPTLSTLRTWFTNSALWFNHHLHPNSTSQQLADRQRGVQFLLGLTVTYALLVQTSELALHVIDFTQIWSNERTGIFEYDDLLVVLAQLA